jgi:hypothetical protein
MDDFEDEISVVKTLDEYLLEALQDLISKDEVLQHAVLDRIDDTIIFLLINLKHNASHLSYHLQSNYLDKNSIHGIHSLKELLILENYNELLKCNCSIKLSQGFFEDWLLSIKCVNQQLICKLSI